MTHQLSLEATFRIHEVLPQLTIMLKHVVCMLFLMQHFHSNFAAHPAYTDDELKPHIEALCRNRLELEKKEWVIEGLDDRLVEWYEKWKGTTRYRLPQVAENHRYNDCATALFALLVATILPKNVPFTSDDLRDPTEDMSQSYLEFCWEARVTIESAVDGAMAFLSGDLQDAVHMHLIVWCHSYEYLLVLTARLYKATIGSTPEFPYSYHDYSTHLGGWPSNTVLMVSEVGRLSKAIVSLKLSEASTVSSLTQASLLLLEYGLTWCTHGFFPPDITIELRGLIVSPEAHSTKDLVKSLVFHQLTIMKLDLIMLAASKFLDMYQQSHSLEGLEDSHIAPFQSAMNDLAHIRWDYLGRIGTLADTLASRWDEESNAAVEVYLDILSSTVAKFKEVEITDEVYGQDEANAKLKNILAIYDVAALQDADELPPDLASLVVLLPSVSTLSPKHLTRYYHLPLWRYRQTLALLRRFRNLYVIELLRDPVITVKDFDQLEAAIITITGNSIEIFDADEETADTYHVPADTWEFIVGSNAKKYIEIVDNEIKSIRKSPEYAKEEETLKLISIFNSDALALIRQVRGIPVKINQLIERLCVSESGHLTSNCLPLECLELTVTLHQLVICRLWREECLLERFRQAHVVDFVVMDDETGLSQTIRIDMVDTMLSRLRSYISQRLYLFSPYEQTASAVGVGVLPHPVDYFRNMVCIDAAEATETGLRDDQRGPNAMMSRGSRHAALNNGRNHADCHQISQSTSTEATPGGQGRTNIEGSSRHSVLNHRGDVAGRHLGLD
ncbi:hypothetical protein SeLEV6574_g01733 [Synchytrium endobioticum]|uniref:Uncharacterized protein n=1 Tax=Synchytrium endobioticum TaxID=286115 RepID=A0A507DDL6_9FUNG|nr:hypothetical protein SeLEV6574_g01733 [Synchytrium endobioticum]